MTRLDSDDHSLVSRIGFREEQVLGNRVGRATPPATEPAIKSPGPDAIAVVVDESNARAATRDSDPQLRKPVIH
jgi:hypothetical protein